MSPSETSGHNKAIAKNTLFLYLRMLAMLIIKLYTTRVLLETLGVDDYGIWNLIYGAVVAFTFISSPLATATQRFFNYDQGTDSNNENKIFLSSLLFSSGIALLIVAVLETGGLWFVFNCLEFPDNLRHSVSVIYQSCVLILFISFLKLPFEALVLSHERFFFYAIISSVEAILLLISILLIHHFKLSAPLILYGYSATVISVLLIIIYIFYCRHNFPLIKRSTRLDKVLFKELFTFSGWNLFGSFSSMISNQGLNVLLNIYYGVVVNAAYGICMQVGGAFALLSNNLIKAANPRIVKLYAENEIAGMMRITSSISKLSFLLIFAIGFIIMNFISVILSIWIGPDYPPYTSVFCVLVIIQVLIVCLALPIDTIMLATGKIRSYQISMSFVISLHFFLSLLFLSLGCQPATVLLIKCVVEVMVLSVRLIYLKRKIGYPVITYCRNIIMPAIGVACLSCAFMALLSLFISFEQNISGILKFTLLYIPFLGLLCWFTYLNKWQRNNLITVVHRFAKRF